MAKTAKLRQWAGRLTGFSIPIFGASWNPPPSERDIAAQLLARLEDRRVLYSPSCAEVPRHCISSVIEVRHMLSDALAQLGGTGVLADHIRAMGAASRRFMDRAGRGEEDDFRGAAMHNHCDSWDFQDALGQMRGIFGVHLAMIAARYDLGVNGDLLGILPAEARDDEFNSRWS